MLASIYHTTESYGYSNPMPVWNCFSQIPQEQSNDEGQKESSNAPNCWWMIAGGASIQYTNVFDVCGGFSYSDQWSLVSNQFFDDRT